MNTRTIVLVILISVVCCRDFYVGMFKKNDWLVAQDRLYKERVPHRYMYAKYGRIFKCKITYFRVADRLGYGPGPRVQIVRGGLRQKYLVLKLTSPYNMPISVNIYVGCANTFTTTAANTDASKPGTQTNATEAGSPGKFTPSVENITGSGNNTKGNGTQANSTESGPAGKFTPSGGNNTGSGNRTKGNGKGKGKGTGHRH